MTLRSKRVRRIPEGFRDAQRWVSARGSLKVAPRELPDGRAVIAGAARAHVSAAGPLHPALLFSFRLRLELLNLSPLLLDFRLLRLQLRLGLRLLILVVLHRVTHDEASARAERAADRCTRARSADRRADDCASASADQCTDARAFLPGAQRLT